MNKEKAVCTYNEILFSLKNKEILMFVTTWMSLEDVMLREINIDSTDRGLYNSQTCRSREWSGGCWGWGQG
jgi:hypothetical protein